MVKVETLNNTSDNERAKTRQFHELYTNYRKKMYCFAYSYLRDETAADDIVMDSFMHCWEYRDTIKEDASPLPYILTTIKNRCINHLKSEQVKLKARNEIYTLRSNLLQTQITSLNACDPTELFAKETRQILSKAIAGLPDKTREIFVRSRLQNQSYKQIIAEMDVSFRSVDYELRKATKILSENLKEYFPDLLPVIILLMLLFD